jgi:hypothetical protein
MLDAKMEHKFGIQRMGLKLVIIQCDYHKSIVLALVLHFCSSGLFWTFTLFFGTFSFLVLFMKILVWKYVFVLLQSWIRCPSPWMIQCLLGRAGAWMITRKVMNLTIKTCIHILYWDQCHMQSHICFIYFFHLININLLGPSEVR